jgi:hypothetical protein
MFEKNIEFFCKKEYIRFSGDKPEPIKFNLPPWYKKLTHTTEWKTIKGCMPFLDTLTFGYLLRVPIDYKIWHNVKEKYQDEKTKEIKEKTLFRVVVPDVNGYNRLEMNLQDCATGSASFHPTSQLGESPLVDKNKGQHFYKFTNPWYIVTPPGYSCLFVPPMSNHDDRFSIIPGIVDTDKWDKLINFPFTMNGDKYPSIETVVKKGTPYVQIIPFKRDDWKMTIKDADKSDRLDKQWFYPFRLLWNYKTDYWAKKKCR